MTRRRFYPTPHPMMLAELLLLIALLVFVVAIIVTYVRAKAIDWTDIGLALVTLSLLVDRGLLS